MNKATLARLREDNERLREYNRDLRAALRECITGEGAPCLARDKKDWMRRRLGCINRIVLDACPDILKGGV